jgi:N-dimethylarginine dimethylaminohydrolase
MSEVAPLRRVVVKHAADAFRDDSRIGREWAALRFTEAPDLRRALSESDRFLELLASARVEILRLPPDDRATLDAIYTRDASIETPRGLVLAAMGKPQRQAEPDIQRQAFAAWNLPIAGAIQAPGRLEGGDVAWLAADVVAVGRGYRTNDAGIAQFRDLLGPAIDVLIVPLPHWHGPDDVFHLMSIISPIDTDLAVVYAPLLPVPFRERLLALGYTLIEVPHEEFASMGANVLAIGPRRCLMLAGNPRTRGRLEKAGAEVLVYDGLEISVKGGGGPTCLTRPVERGPR